MIQDNDILREDLNSFTLPDELTERLRDKTFIVTGATGLIGSSIVRCLTALGIGIRFILPVRNPDKARELFGRESESVLVEALGEGGLVGWFEVLTRSVDYIIHCASPTDGSFMCRYPLETFMLPIESGRAMLDYAMRVSAGVDKGGVRGIVYVSSMEYYGRIADDEQVDESREGYVDRQSPRSAYALGKQATEYMCYCYAHEYGVPVKSARLTQTFGAGISQSDNRVFAQFARSVISGRDIVLHTEGHSAKPYCYTTDCVSALIYVLLRGEKGESYNVATPGTYVSIRELAEIFRSEIDPSIRVIIQKQETNGYAPETKVNLDPGRLLALGWKPRYDLHEMIRRLVEYLKTDNL